MQDYRTRDGYYHYELDKSIHPAYPFRMSARDCARYGLLFLNRGVWGDQRVLSEAWIERSTKSYSDTNEPGGGYGYMWWTFKDPETGEHAGYTARGVGGQTIAVLPQDRLVIVNRTDTYMNKDVGTAENRKLTKMILDARTEAGAERPALAPLESDASPAAELGKVHIARLIGTYEMLDEQAEVRAEDGHLLLDIPGSGVFGLQPVDDEGVVFLVEDIELHLACTEPAKGEQGRFTSEYALMGDFSECMQDGDMEGALLHAEQALELFPMSATAHVMLAQAFLATGDPKLAADLARTALELDPGHEGARRLRNRLIEPDTH
jgi:tetratricopeptide (TPR) repeat protein